MDYDTIETMMNKLAEMAKATIGVDAEMATLNQSAAQAVGLLERIAVVLEKIEKHGLNTYEQNE